MPELLTDEEEKAATTAEIQDLFAGLGVEEGEYVGGEGGDEAAIGGVGFGVPGLAGFGCGGHRCIVRLSGDMREEDKNLQNLDKRERGMGTEG